jgi:hypothetical protein
MVCVGAAGVAGAGVAGAGVAAACGAGAGTVAGDDGGISVGAGTGGSGPFFFGASRKPAMIMSIMPMIATIRATSSSVKARADVTLADVTLAGVTLAGVGRVSPRAGSEFVLFTIQLCKN